MKTSRDTAWYYRLHSVMNPPRTGLLSLLASISIFCAAADDEPETEESAHAYFTKKMVESLRMRGFTNVSESDLLKDSSIYFTNMFRVHAALPEKMTDWPTPETADTNKMSQILAFIEKHGWNMDKRGHFLMPGLEGKPLRGLPWSPISTFEFPAVTRGGVLYVVLMGFGPESSGVAWNPHTNRFDPTINGFRPLGKGWYCWKQTMTPPEPGWQIYEGEAGAESKEGDSKSNSQPLRPGTNRVSKPASPSS